MTKDISFDDLRNAMLYHRIVEWKDNYIRLDNGMELRIEETAQDCCASAGGQFEDVKLDAAITAILCMSNGAILTFFIIGFLSICLFAVFLHDHILLAIISNFNLYYAKCIFPDTNGSFTYKNRQSLILFQNYFVLV